MTFDVRTQRFTGSAAKGINCLCCGLSFAIPETLHQNWVARKRAVTCPGCAATLYPAGQTEAEQLRDELVREKQRTEQAEADARYQRSRVALKERQISARKAVTTRLRNKLTKGRCPCCSHEFKDLRRHMKVEHPKWNLEKAANAIAAKADA